MTSLSQSKTLAEKADYRREAKVELLGGIPSITLVKIYADKFGKSHFRKVKIETTLTDFAPPASPIYLSDPTEAKVNLFLVFPVDWYGKPHPAPKRQLLVFLSGSVEVIVSDGESRLFNPGDFCLLEDTLGEGHVTRNVGTEPVLVSVTQFQ